MAALQLLPGHEFDPDAFAAFLAAQPDLGRLWCPRFIRLLEAMPTTATRKIAKPVLRQESWLVDDPVFTYDAGRCIRLDAEAARALRVDYARHDRSPAGY